MKFQEFRNSRRAITNVEAAELFGTDVEAYDTLGDRVYLYDDGWCINAGPGFYRVVMPTEIFQTGNFEEAERQLWTLHPDRESNQYTFVFRFTPDPEGSSEEVYEQYVIHVSEDDKQRATVAAETKVKAHIEEELEGICDFTDEDLNWDDYLDVVIILDGTCEVAK